jgi:hypothetical protein
LGRDSDSTASAIFPFVAATHNKNPVSKGSEPYQVTLTLDKGGDPLLNAIAPGDI